MSKHEAWCCALLIFVLSCGHDEDVAFKLGENARAPVGDRVEQLLSARLNPTRQAGELGALLDEARSEDLDDLKSRFEAASAYLHPSDLEQFASWWAGFDPGQAIENPQTAGTSHLDFWQVQVLRAWASRDPHAAHEAWSTELCSASDDLCLMALVAGWYESGDQGVWAFVEGLSAGVSRQRAMDILAASLIAKRGVDEALRFAEAIDPKSARRFKLQFFRRLATALALRDVDKARIWAEKHADGPFGDGLLRRVAVRWVARNGATAVQWLFSLPAGPQRDDAVQAGSRRWIRSDRATAVEWLSQSTDEEALQPALGVLAVARAREDPMASLELVQKITVEQDRENATVAVLRIWLSAAPKDANAWLEQANLDERLLTRIRANPSPAHPRRSRG